MWYAVRPNATAGFINKTLLWSYQSEPANLTAKNVSIDVGPDHKPQIAIVFTTGRVVVTDATLTNVSNLGVIASTSSFGGISLAAAGNGFPNHSLAYTAPDGRARFVEQTGPTTWSAPVDITSAANTGYYPKLISSAKGQSIALARSWLCYTYNDTAKRIQVAAPDSFSSAWLAPVAIETDTSASFSSIDADSLRGKQGVTYVLSTDTTSVVRYASRTTGSWTIQSASSASELGSTAESFNTPAMRFDAGGNPVIAYTRNLFNLTNNGTLDIRSRRLIPGGAWELSIVDNNSGLDLYQTNGLALATSPSGDPALVYEKDPGSGNSTFTFARPASAPWVTGVPEELTTGLFAGSLAPALGRGPDGTHYLVASPVTSTGFAGPALFTYRNGTTTSLQLLGSGNIHPENAITVTPDGTVHIISMRVGVGNTVADLFYHRVRNGVAVFNYLVNVGSSPIDIAQPGQLSLGHDATGALYLAFRNAAGGMTLNKLPANTPPYGIGETPWLTLATVPGNLIGIDLAVRPDGATAVSYYDTAARTVNLHTNVDLGNSLTANRLPGFGNGPVYTVPAADQAPRNTTVDLQSGERPAVAWGSGGRLRLSRWQFNLLGGSPSFPVTEIDNGYQTPDVQLLRSGSTLYFAIYDNTANGSFTWLQSPNSSPASITRQAFASPGIGLSTDGGRVTATLDQHNFPVMAAGTSFFTLFPFSTVRSVFLARPGDAMDYDNDGASLLQEGAYGLNPTTPDAQLQPQPVLGSFSQFLGGSYTAFDAAHRTPDVPATPAAVGMEKYGEFTYAPEISASLTSWAAPSYGSGLTAATRLVLIPPTLPAGVVMRYPQVQISSAYQAANPRMFFRHTVQRDR